jgi:hypothetical protein
MPAVNTTYTFQDSDVITSVKMNNIIDQTTFVASGISGQTLEVTTSGQLKVRSQNITSNELASNAVTTTKITDGSVTPAKLSTGAPSWDTAGTVLLGVFGETASLTRAAGVDGAFTISNSGPIVFNDVPLGIQEGTAPIYGNRAWAKLNPYVGSVRTGAYKAGNYSRAATETTVTITGHGLKTNDKIRLDFTSGGATDGLYTVTSSASANEFIVDHGGTVVSGNVTAQFVKIQASGNISTASFYDSGNDRIVLNFEIEMPDENYATLVTGQYYPGSWLSLAGEDTLGTTQLNTKYQSHIFFDQTNRFLNVAIIG